VELSAHQMGAYPSRRCRPLAMMLAVVGKPARVANLRLMLPFILPASALCVPAACCKQDEQTARHSGGHSGQPSSHGFWKQVFLAISDRSPMLITPSLFTS